MEVKDSPSVDISIRCVPNDGAHEQLTKRAVVFTLTSNSMSMTSGEDCRAAVEALDLPPNTILPWEWDEDGES